MAALCNRAGHYIFVLWFLLLYMSETCCTRSLQIQDANNRQKFASGHHRTTLSGYIFATKAHVENRKKNLLSSHISSTCPHNMVNFGLLAAEIVPVVWSTPANFNRFRVLAALLNGPPAVGVSQTLWREQRAPPIFGRAAITLVIGPHSSLAYFTSEIDVLSFQNFSK